MAAEPWSPVRAAASAWLPRRRWPRSGAHVTLLARTAAEITEAAREIREAGGCAGTLVLDVTDLARCALRSTR